VIANANNGISNPRRQQYQPNVLTRVFLSDSGNFSGARGGKQDERQADEERSALI
jgi:hypothetical protein